MDAVIFPFEKLRAGDSWGWTAQLADNPAPTWTLKFILRGQANLDLIATADGSSHKVSATAAQTKDLPAGSYTWAAVATKGVEVATVKSGTVEILPDLVNAATGFDGRSWAKRCLDAIEAVLEGRAGAPEKNYQIGGRSVGFMTPDELLANRTKFQALVKAELAESGQRGAQSNSILVRFG